MGTKIKDAELISKVTGEELIPVSDGSGKAKAIKAGSIKNIPVVDAEDKLESLGLAQGQIAAVAVDTLELKSFSELYQPIQTLPISKPSDFDNWDKVIGITCEIPYGLSSGDNESLVIVPRTFYEDPACLYRLIIADVDGVPRIGIVEGVSNTVINIVTVSNGELNINQSAVDEFNEILSNGDFIYAGSVRGNFSIIDLGVKVKGGNRIADLYINNGNLFEKIVSKKELEAKASKIIQKRNNMSFSLDERTLQDNTSIDVHINTDYTVFKIHGGVGVRLVKLPTINKDEMHEYIIEYHCLGSPFYFSKEVNLVWENDTPPAFETNTIVRITIINGLATYKVFPMST